MPSGEYNTICGQPSQVELQDGWRAVASVLIVGEAQTAHAYRAIATAAARAPLRSRHSLCRSTRARQKLSVDFFHDVIRNRRRRGEGIMEGKRFRRIQNGCIYEIIGRDETPGGQPCWILWNEREGKEVFAVDFQLKRQVGWELVGKSDQPETTAREAPPALMKK